MHELNDILEKIFNSRIVLMQVDQEGNTEYGHSINGNLSIYSAYPHSKVRLSLAVNSYGDRYLHIFQEITNNARVTSVQYGCDSYSTITCIVEFVVFNFEDFKKDIEKYSWKHFDGEFTTQLDKVLEEE